MTPYGVYTAATIVAREDDHWTIADLPAGAGEGIVSPPAPPCADLLEAFQQGLEAPSAAGRMSCALIAGPLPLISTKHGWVVSLR